ncbi:Anaerobic nitric oxide reductase transcription regulator NorR [bioreactor metagenome]|uniref:Anaerobic nitric oxide reductase transcription regulator NorR n=1 Tax=bioreactor metagenome TaxID=1076179 RepID=A0A644SWD8_9ZZZZ|nr:sigma-54 dependent transcriptional regulator [Negativicutes bacterium]
MIRERRSREKLENYYRKYTEEGVLDPNTHPWVAESWKRSRARGIANETMPPAVRLSKEELADRRKTHQDAIGYLDGLYNEVSEYFNSYNLSLFILDNECYSLKNYAMPFFQRTPGEVEGMRLSERDIGTSSISIAYEHKTTFLMFGPEMWVRDCQDGDACSTPVVVDGELKYILTLVSVDQDVLPYNAIVSLLLSMKYALEKHLSMQWHLKARDAILDAAPFAVYHIVPGGSVVYTNKLGRSRLAKISEDTEGDDLPNLSSVVLNYRHTPLFKGFKGIPSYNKEVTWITANKTYEDITTVVPLERDQDNIINSVVAVTMPIEDLRTLVAHAVGYKARYNLNSMVGQAPSFVSMQEKAGRVARNNNNVLLQGEPGTGKERLAHGIHQGSSRAAGPLISVMCGAHTPELLEVELFGTAEGTDESRPGKLELANGGTLFFDEIEKMPAKVAAKLTGVLTSGISSRVGENIKRNIDVRVISACDSDLKRLTDKGVFRNDLYELLSKSVIRIPPLRARREDIPLLASHIIGEVAEQHQLKNKNVAAEAAELLMHYDWPGNIKQLQGVVEHAFFNTIGDTIKSTNISLLADAPVGNAWKEDKEVFVKAWQAAGGNISRLANMLDVSRVTLYRYLKKYGLSKE